MAKSDTSERTYLGPANTFSPGAGKKAIAPGEKVSLTEDQYRQLTGMGHSFDPAWTDPNRTRLPAPHEVPDLDPAQAQPPAIIAIPQEQQEQTITA